MVKLDYKTNNLRWGLSGIEFKNWKNYSFTLGYLSNPAHYNNLNPGSFYANISLHIEKNNKQGAWGKEGRIHYYGELSDLKVFFDDLYNCSSNGTGRITQRINSNGYILSLVDDYNFERQEYMGYTTVDVFPPKDKNNIENYLRGYLLNGGMTTTQIQNCIDFFNSGYKVNF